MRLMTAALSKLAIQFGGPGSGPRPGSLHEVARQKGFTPVSTADDGESGTMRHYSKGRLDLDEGSGRWHHSNFRGVSKTGVGSASLYTHLSQLK